MHISELNNSISTLPGIGPSKQALFSRLNIFTIADLLQFYPRDYEDRTQKSTIAQSMQNQTGKVHTIAQIVGHEWFGYGKMKTLKLIASDGSGLVELVAFNRPFMEKTHPVGQIAALTAKCEIKYGKYQSTSFELEKISDGGELSAFEGIAVPNSKVFPIYPLTEGLTNKILTKTIQAAFKQFSLGLENDLPAQIIEKRHLLSKKDAIRQIHFPKTLSEAIGARNSLVFEELFLFQKTLAERAIAHRGKLPRIEVDTAESTQKQVSEEEFVANLSTRQKNLLARLPYKLTPDQMSVIALMNEDIDRNYGFYGGVAGVAPAERGATNEVGAWGETSPSHSSLPHFSMRTLLQGDVGSGKTLVSFFAALRVIDYGGQVALMAPTELLARQHAENAAKQLEAVGVSVAYLTGNIKTKGRDNLLAALKKGDINLVIGTHALFSKNVQYHDLALAIIDEQHRFGVMQRSAILDKGRTSVVATDKYAQPPFREPNLLMMSATPIPQTLALTVFGDLDVRTIHTMPQGRKPVVTYLSKAGNERNAYEAVRKELNAGHQAYFVYPAIEGNLDSGEFGSDSFGKQSLKSAEESFNFLQTQVYPNYKCALIHSKIDEESQNQILQDFRENKIQVLVATTVVEVGVDVPNATCMVIEQADRFGLAALHQLRGRVGRGKAQSYCFLIYRSNITENGIARMKALHETSDGFKIAEEDLRLRGPGEITGTAQSGDLEFKIANLARDEKIMKEARIEAFSIISQEEVDS
ncbi:ATP-dependent DNA helicase RecG [Treponema ruminis]|uniref:Probable DNA 3'-5' helicase RecG n=1 Tax=Treponema ruminis TaxID=744515 RepID=A0A7W8G6L6_9SPIR|nr:ATP-dependent DNA helicase RecG [Treponema ruminis]MBB5224785.1 ATP-dependent DNA helicase RecG [Treponema ruminis]